MHANKTYLKLYQLLLHDYRGALRYYHKMYDSAIEDLSRAIRLDSRHASLAHFNRAVCYQALGKLHMVTNYSY